MNDLVIEQPKLSVAELNKPTERSLFDPQSVNSWNPQYIDTDLADQMNGFQLVSHNSEINLLLDLSSGVIGLALRLRQLTSCNNIDLIYQQVVEDIIAIELHLNQSALDSANIFAWRYILCCFVDELVMGTAWGADSVWAEHSLLTRFHGETWGGEKVFSIISRLQTEPEQFQQLLYFAFICLSLGLQGQFKVIENGAVLHQQFLETLYQSLADAQSEDQSQLTDAKSSVIKKKYRPVSKIPLWSVYCLFVAILAAVYLSYVEALEQQTSILLSQLEQMFNS